MANLPASITILAIESSCDETAASILRHGRLLSNVVAGQEVHSNYGGVIPELASRAHQSNIVPVVQQALEQAGCAVSDLDAIAWTRGPGLMGSLMVGAGFAKGMAISLGIPLVPVNHLQAHVAARYIEEEETEFPFLCLLVSGGHTQLIRVAGPMDMEIIGSTRDDAAGEAFDKGAKLLGLPYPGGPLVDRLAADGDPKRFAFPVSEMPGLDYSFSGIKTSLMYYLNENTNKDEHFIQNNLKDICASYQAAIIKALVSKLKKAVHETGIRDIAVAGGVSANRGLRRELMGLSEKHGWKLHIPSFEYCTDNAAMIAAAGAILFAEGKTGSLDDVPVTRF